MASRYILLVLSIFSSCISYANRDSLLSIWNDVSNHDSIRIKAVDELIEEYNFKEPINTDLAFNLTKKKYQFCLEKGLDDEVFEVRGKLAFAYWVEKNFDSSIVLANKNFSESLVKSDTAKMKSALQQLYFLSLKGTFNFDKAEQYLLELTRLNFLLNSGSRGYCINLNELGGFYKGQGNFEKSIDYLYQALRLADALEFTLISGETRQAIAEIYLSIGVYNKSLILAREAMRFKIKSMPDRSPILCNNLIGKIYLAQEKLDSAEKYFKLDLTPKRWIHKSRLLNGLASICMKKGQLDSAETLLNESISICEEIDGIPTYRVEEEYANTLNKLAEFYYLKGNNNASITHAKGAFVKGKQAGNTLHLQTSLFLEYKSLRKINRPDPAVRKLERYLNIKDSIQDNNSKLSLFVQDFLYNQQKKNLNDSLQKAEFERVEMEKKEAALKKKKEMNRLQYSAIVIIVLLLASVISLSGKLNISPGFVEGLIFIFFILLFEFLLVITDPWIDQWSDGQVGIKLFINSLFALIIFFGHHYFEGKLKSLIMNRISKTSKNSFS